MVLSAIPSTWSLACAPAGWLQGVISRSGHRHDRHVTAYYAVAPSVFQGIIVRWRRCRPVAPIDAYTFVDLGAGMGRAMLLAAAYPFRAVVGVELHPTLARIARRNLALWRAAGRSRAHPCAWSAAMPSSFRFLPGRAWFFSSIRLARPCCGGCCSTWNENLRERAGQLDILYVNNEQENVLAERAGIRAALSAARSGGRTPMPSPIAKFSRSQPGGEYAAPGWEDCSIYRWVGSDRE